LTITSVALIKII